MHENHVLFFLIYSQCGALVFLAVHISLMSYSSNAATLSSNPKIVQVDFKKTTMSVMDPRGGYRGMCPD